MSINDTYYNPYYRESDLFYCPYCMVNIEVDEYGIFLHEDVYHPDDFSILDYLVMH